MASFEALPNETVYLIAAHLCLRRDLATLCLVSKSLNVLLTSSLYQTVYLGLASHVERLIERFAAEDDVDSTPSTRFNVSAGVRCLVFDDERYTLNHIREQLLCDDVISRFELVVSRLKNLKAIAWRSHWLPQNTKLFKSFRHHCSDLKHVEIQNWGRYFSSGKDHYAESLFGFKGLHHVSVTSRLIPPGQTNCSQTNVALKYNIPSTGQSRCPPPITQLVRSCPELEFLELICGDDTSTMSRMWSPNKLLQEVGMVLPSLRTLRLGGNMTRHWPIMLSGTFYMRSFMENHPMLRSISFSWKPGLNEDHGLTPESVATLFPSLRHFEGPAFLCVVVLGSTVSSQLESLSVLDTRIVRDNWRSTGQEFMHFRGLANATRSLPHLHSLKFYLRTNGNDEEDQLQCRAVSSIARAAPGLKELVMEGMRIDGQLTIIEALRSAPQLRSLTARVLIMTPRILHDLSTTCPMLEELHDTHKPHMRTSWRISRRLNGDVDSYKLEALSV